jgi:hypothetical protein
MSVVTIFPTFFQDTDDPASVALALTITADLNPTVVPGAAFPGLFLSTPHFLSLTLSIHGNRTNIKTSFCSILCVFHPTDPGKRLCIFRPSAPSPWPHFVSLLLVR